MANEIKPKYNKMRAAIGAQIRERRQSLELSQQDLADSIGIRKATLIDIEHGRPCELNTLIVILGAMNGRLKIEW